jgi:hypothetical protein
MTQILISLGILALWALTSLLSRDAQPLPARPMRERPDDRNRRSPSVAATRINPPGAELGARSADRKVGPTFETRLLSRAGETSVSPRYGAAGARPTGDEIRVLESRLQSARPLSSSAGVTGSDASILSSGSRGAARRGSRSRTSQSPGTGKPTEPERPRALSAQIHKSLAQTVSRPLEITPLESPLESLSSSFAPLEGRGAAELARGPRSASGLDAKTVSKLLGSPEKLREVALLTEVLRPPLALRQRRRIR